MRETNKKHRFVRCFDFWQDTLCNSRTDEIKELLLFGKDVKVFSKKCIPEQALGCIFRINLNHSFKRYISTPT